ncbi:MAG TPA: hypothetical protein VF635_07025 [Propionibacteriaceae bacterium]
MTTSTPITASQSAQDVDLGIFAAVLVTEDRLHVLRDLTHQAVAHFGRDHLYVSNLSVVSTNAGASWIASAGFSMSPLAASQA